VAHGIVKQSGQASGTGLPQGTDQIIRV
jgi:hypothetical protein